MTPRKQSPCPGAAEPPVARGVWVQAPADLAGWGAGSLDAWVPPLPLGGEGVGSGGQSWEPGRPGCLPAAPCPGAAPGVAGTWWEMEANARPPSLSGARAAAGRSWAEPPAATGSSALPWSSPLLSPRDRWAGSSEAGNGSGCARPPPGLRGRGDLGATGPPWQESGRGGVQPHGGARLPEGSPRSCRGAPRAWPGLWGVSGAPSQARARPVAGMCSREGGEAAKTPRPQRQPRSRRPWCYSVPPTGRTSPPARAGAGAGPRVSPPRSLGVA